MQRKQMRDDSQDSVTVFRGQSMAATAEALKMNDQETTNALTSCFYIKTVPESRQLGNPSVLSRHARTFGKCPSHTDGSHTNRTGAGFTFLIPPTIGISRRSRDAATIRLSSATSFESVRDMCSTMLLSLREPD